MLAEPLQPTQYAAALGTIALTYYLVPYFLDPYNYRRRFSGPWLAGLTGWWMSYNALGGNHSEIVRKQHEKYGAFVRLGPNHISIADPDALQAVYGHGSGVLKTDFYKGSGQVPNVFTSMEKSDHQMRRKRIANIFSQQNILAFEPRVREHIIHLLKRGSRETLDGKQGADFIDKLLQVKNEDGSSISIEELYSETFLFLLAGSDTSSNTLSSLCYHLAINPQMQRELQTELDQHIPLDSSDDSEEQTGLGIVPEYEQIKDLPYLNACIKEALRIHSTVGTGLPRVVPPGKTLKVAGHTFKAGSVISVPSYTTNRSSVWGPDASEFRPERWLEENAGSLNKYFVPFSVGPRSCIGRNLANMDLLLIAATLFRRYSVKALPTTKLEIHEYFVREAAHCEVAIKLREVV
ncbi:unnamed protein product [Rhizoctonia solani]|uniref:Benzoate 4-monooxygenase n=1 Tax=Rhizoctonia solani TaxID=456999 RepID=A0A8H3HYY4_9AGAM|nr:unnamed protein product [Rhizoctonia solani]